MKNLLKPVLSVALFMSTFSCEEELEVPLSSLTTDDVVPTIPFVEKIVVGAYAGLEMRREAAASNWTFGGCASDNAHKGSTPGDQSAITEMEVYDVFPNNPYVTLRWENLYEGIVRCNTGLNLVTSGVEGGLIDAENEARFRAELRFLRGFYHFMARMTYGNVPYIDEETTETPPNDTDIYPQIEADFQFAIDNLDDPVRVGGASTWNAQAFLAKVYMYQLNYAAAKPLLKNIYDHGPYSLNANFHDNFNAATNNSPESVFAVNYAANDGVGASQDNGNEGDELNYPHSASPFGCCGFYQPSHDLVNAYLVDAATGLPLPMPTDGTDYVANVDPGNPNALPFNYDADAGVFSFAEETRPLDPRLDWTVARPGIPLFDWGDFSVTWVRDAPNGGPYHSKKLLWPQAQQGFAAVSGGWGQNINVINTNLIRYSEIILWRAEIAAALDGDLLLATAFVNEVRSRVRDHPDTWVKELDGVTNAANYQIGLYPNPSDGGFGSVQEALDAILREYRLETALEGHRFFDLVRLGRAKEILDAYLSRPTYRQYLDKVTSFPVTRGIYPLPQSITDLSPQLTQNSY